MRPAVIEELRSRIRRTESVVRDAAAPGYAESHTLADGTTHEYAITGVKSPERMRDELLSLFVWVWSFKDHLKEAYKAKQLDPQLVEEIANRSLALQYVADIANRAKHGVLRKSRSGTFAELVDVGFTVPQSAISRISVGAFSVGVDVSNPGEVEVHALVRPRGRDAIDAFEVLAGAIDAWELHAIKQIAV